MTTHDAAGDLVQDNSVDSGYRAFSAIEGELPAPLVIKPSPRVALPVENILELARLMGRMAAARRRSVGCMALIDRSTLTLLLLTLTISIFAGYLAAQGVGP